MTHDKSTQVYTAACRAAEKILTTAAGTPWLRHAEAIAQYLRDGVPPGGAVTAILEGNLYSAVGRADSITSAHLAALARAVIWCAPSGVYGSRERVAAWIAWHAERRNAA